MSTNKPPERELKLVLQKCYQCHKFLKVRVAETLSFYLCTPKEPRDGCHGYSQWVLRRRMTWRRCGRWL